VVIQGPVNTVALPEQKRKEKAAEPAQNEGATSRDLVPRYELEQQQEPPSFTSDDQRGPKPPSVEARQLAEW
jgi:hypothetical protein